MDYNQMIENVVMPQSGMSSDQGKNFTDLINYVSSQKPTHLYRFRTITDYNLSALYKDELYFSKGSSMNDDFDARIYYDMKTINKWIDSFIDDDGSLKIIKSLVSSEEIPIEVYRTFPNAKVMIDAFKQMPMQQIIDISKELIGFIRDNLESELEKNTQSLRDLTKFACFSQSVYSDMMWGHYAGNATGFAIEYDFDNQCTIYKTNSGTIWGNLFPIVYGKHRLDMTSYAIYLFKLSIINRMATIRGVLLPQQVINTIVPCPDEFMVTKVAIKKSNEWRPEKEWRLFFTTDDNSVQREEHPHVIQKASAVYLGRKTSSINEKIIVDIAREKHIPVFKMTISNTSKTYRLGKKLIYKPL